MTVFRRTFRSGFLGGAVGAAVVLFASSASAQDAALQPAAESRALGTPGATVLTRPAKAAAKSDGGKHNWIGSTVIPLAGVLGLAAVGARLLRTAAKRSGSLRSALGAGGRAPSGIMEILGRYPVSRGATLVLLKLDSRVLLLSQTSGGRFGAGAGFQTLAEINDPEEVASILIRSRDAEGDSLAERFRSMLHRFDRQIEDKDGEAVWEGVRSDIPVIDLTKRSDRPGKPSRTLRARISGARAKDESGAIA